MATIDKTRNNNFMQKKTICFFAAEILEGTGNDDIPAGSGDYKLGNLPPDSIITDAYIHVETASDATTAAASLGTTDTVGGEILTGVDLKTTGKQGTFAGQSLTGTGTGLILAIATTGTPTNVGNYKVVVEYLEYTKNTGEYTTITK